MANFLTVKQLSAKYSAFPEGGIRHLLFNKETNGFNRCAKKVAGKVLIDEDAFLEYVGGSGANTKDDDINPELRDEFAAKAMQGIFASYKEAIDCFGSCDSVAREAYHMADAMLKARKPNPNNKEK